MRAVVWLLLLFLCCAAQTALATTFCQRYTASLVGGDGLDAANQTALMRLFMQRAVQGYVGDADTAGFYGIVAGMPENPASALFAHTNATLFEERLAGFFGPGLGCDTMPAYEFSADGGGTLYAVHRALGVTFDMFVYFNAQVTQAMSTLGVATADLERTVLPLLLSFGRCAVPYTQAVCSVVDDSCPFATPAEPGCVGAVVMHEGELAKRELRDYGVGGAVLLALLCLFAIVVGTVWCCCACTDTVSRPAYKNVALRA